MYGSYTSDPSPSSPGTVNPDVDSGITRISEENPHVLGVYLQRYACVVYGYRDYRSYRHSFFFTPDKAWRRLRVNTAIVEIVLERTCRSSNKLTPCKHGIMFNSHGIMCNLVCVHVRFIVYVHMYVCMYACMQWTYGCTSWVSVQMGNM